MREAAKILPDPVPEYVAGFHGLILNMNIFYTNIDIRGWLNNYIYLTTLVESHFHTLILIVWLNR